MLKNRRREACKEMVLCVKGWEGQQTRCLSRYTEMVVLYYNCVLFYSKSSFSGVRKLGCDDFS